MRPDQLVEVNAAAARLVRTQFGYLVRRYGSNSRYRDGWGNHNATHGIRVAWHAARGAARQVAAGTLPREAVALALIAGVYHDHVQTEQHSYDLNPGRLELSYADQQDAVLRYTVGRPVPGSYDLSARREELSVGPAHEAMRGYESEHGYQPGELFGPAGYDLVEEMILATRVRAVSTDGIEAMVSGTAGAVMADADTSDLGLTGGPYRALQLQLERNQGLLAIPAFSDGTGLALDTDRTLPYLEFQEQLHRGHDYELAASRELFPFQEVNADLIGELRRDFQTGRIRWPEMLDRTAALLRTEPVPSRAGSELIPDPLDIVPDLVPALRGLEPGVAAPPAPLDPDLTTARDLAGIDFARATVLKPAGDAAAPRRGPRQQGLSR